MQEFLRSTDVVDWDQPEVARLASSLRKDNDVIATVRACFHFVRDEVQHSADAQCGAATCRASDVLAHRTGYCYAKSHLLAALVRANGIPVGFCYQRLSVNDAGAPFCLHGFNAILLPDVGWYRVDPRGNRAGIDAQFDPPRERLAFAPQTPGEAEFENILPDPLPCVVAALTQSLDWKEVLERLPDVSPEDFGELGFDLRSQTQTP
jgi:transglutaminase-like putative cysteine protease